MCRTLPKSFNKKAQRKKAPYKAKRFGHGGKQKRPNQAVKDRRQSDTDPDSAPSHHAAQRKVERAGKIGEGIRVRHHTADAEIIQIERPKAATPSSARHGE